MDWLFRSGKIGNLELKNRFVRSATGECLAAADGQVTDALVSLYTDLAKGGVGLIITGVTFVHESGRSGYKMPGLHRDEMIPGWQRLVSQVHAYGAKIAPQLFHCGRQMQSDSAQAFPPMAPSPIAYKRSGITPREMTEEQIWEMIGAFAEAARRAGEAGFDGVQLHGAHGYLISQFLSPYSNRRTDRWGGNFENRQRFVREVYQRIRGVVGQDYPVFIKMNVDDFVEGGLTLEETRETAKRLSDLGMDAIEISGGMLELTIWKCMVPGIKSTEQEAYFLPYAEAIKSEIHCPLILVGGMRTPARMEEILRQNKADFISLCRPFIREPDLVNKIQQGQQESVTCISCNKCMRLLDKGLACYVDA
ncbi:MAG: NADH:flavin oxidoreductase [Nitrospinae bacterium]|nr:NADH:flavin oxidoreductase [Nitrospinota bacterium]